jgi:hypothetical protein
VLKKKEKKFVAKKLHMGIKNIKLDTEFESVETNAKDSSCSARDWDGKDYLRIIPRVVW